METFKTLSDFPAYSKESQESLEDYLLRPLQGAVGYITTGECTLQKMGNDWGEAFRLVSGEKLFIKVFTERNVARPISRGEVRTIATRRVSPNLPDVTSIGIFFNRPETFSGDLLANNAVTAGCRAIALVNPLVFSLHDSKRNLRNVMVDVNSQGFRSLRPTVLTIMQAPDKKKKTQGVIVAPGDYTFIAAAHLAGVQIEDPLRPVFSAVSEEAHAKHTDALTRTISKKIGRQACFNNVAAAITIAEALTAEGFLNMASMDFLQDALPDMIVSPIGLPLLVAFSVRVAAFPERYGLERLPSAVDVFACAEASVGFHSAFDMLVEPCRAIDLAIRSGIDNARNKLEGDEGNRLLQESLHYWQLSGQRIVTRMMVDVSNRGENTETRFGRADLVTDEISASKYRALGRYEFCHPVAETPVTKLWPACSADAKQRFLGCFCEVETWLRTGRYRDMQTSKPNVNVIKKMATSNGDVDADSILDHKLCLDAMESATGAIAVSLVHGSSVCHQFPLHCFIFSETQCNECADCGNLVSVARATLTASRASACVRCGRKRCLACETKQAQGEAKKTCSRCI